MRSDVISRGKGKDRKKIFIIIFTLNLLSLWVFYPKLIVAQSSDTQDSKGIFFNPFLVERVYTIKSIVGVKADKRLAGYIDRPEEISIYFSVRGDEVDIPRLPGEYFHYQIVNQNHTPPQYHTVSANTYYRGDGYFARLKMPKVDMEGSYDFLITVYGDEEKSIRVTRRLPNFFQYRQKKIDVIFLIDDSGSMNRNDPRRLRYQEIYRVFQNPKLASKIDELAVISFSDDSQTLFPFGKVTDFLRKKISLGGRGDTDFSKPFLLAEKLIREDQWDQDQKAMIFLTDGIANHPYADEHIRMRNLGIPVYTVGLSENKKFKEYQPAFLQKIAQDTRGEFFEARADVIGEVFKKFIDLSTASMREFVVVPLKKRYAYNELVHIDYRSSSTYERDLEMKGYFIFPEREEVAEIYQKNPGRITLYPPSLNINPNSFTNENETSYPKIDLRVMFLWRGKVFFDETSNIEIGGDSARVGLIYFRKIDLLNYDIRYFPVVNLTKENLFIDIFLPQKNNSWQGNANPAISSVSFKEIPFLLASGEERSQAVVFSPQKSSSLNLEEIGSSQVVDMVLETSKGDFLNQIHFDYLFQVKKTISALPKTGINQTKNRFFISILTAVTIFFLILLVFKKLNIKRKVQDLFNKSP